MNNIEYKFKYWCNNENDWVFTNWLKKLPDSLVCPNDHNHIISTDISPCVYEKRNNNTILIREENKETNGFYQTTTKLIDIPDSIDTYEFNITPFKFPINLLSTSFVSTNDHIGDEINVIVGRDTIITTPKQNINSNQNIIELNNVEYLYVGDYITIEENNISNNLGVITKIIKSSNTVYVENNTTNEFTSAANIKKNTYYVKDFIIGYPFKYSFGTDKIGGSYIPANIPITIIYKNNSNVAKKLYFQVNYLR